MAPPIAHFRALKYIIPFFLRPGRGLFLYVRRSPATSPPDCEEPRRGGAVQIWGGNSLAVNQCQRWLEMFTVFGRDAVQAPGPAVRGRPSVGDGARAGTRARRERRGVRRECRSFV